MSKTVNVTPAQVNAAKLKVRRFTKAGRPVPASVLKIANARRVEAEEKGLLSMPDGTAADD
ncbi:hypothetical protein [Thalassiella azotivora]